MIIRNFVFVALLASATALTAGPPFIPSGTFQGSSLNGWHMLGQADWKASNGEIAGTPKSPTGGWLLMDQSLQDVGVYASFRCPAGCKTGIILRAQKTADGMKGLYVSLTEGDSGLFRITLDAEGKETSREKLPPTDPLQRFGKPLQRAFNGGGRGPGRGAPPPAPEWNTIQTFIDADVLRGTLGANVFALGFGVTGDEGIGFGSVGFYVGGTAEVRFKDIAYLDLRLKEEPKEQLSSHFKMQRLSEYYYSFGVTAADMNHDGVLDLIAGPYYYLGPDYTKRREIYAASTYSPSSEFSDKSWLNFAADFTGDGWPDLLTTGAGRVATLYVNPKVESRRWDKFVVMPASNTEIAVMKDINNDGRPEILLGIDGVLMWVEPDPANPTAQWIQHKISGPDGVSAHGIGVGDINGDGRMDVTTNTGWYEQPKDGAKGTWIFHPEDFGTRGGAEMGIYDVNGDGLADVVTALNAHGFGLAWFEQKRDAAGEISFVKHMIMDDFSTKNAGDVTFTEPHGSTFADVDGDGIPDFIVGKRYWSHRDTYLDPDPYGAPVLYWYRTVRDKSAPGGARFVPELIHNRSGAGSQVLAEDFNKDGAMDIAVSTNRGTFIFWGTLHKK